MIPKTWLIYVSIASILASFLVGWTVNGWRWEATYSAALEKAAKEKDAIQKKLDNSSVEYQQLLATMEPARIETRNNIREIYRNVEVSTDCTPPVSAVSLLEGARNRANAATSGRPSTEVQ